MNPAELVTATLGIFSTFLPNPITVRHHDPRDVRKEKDLRLGQLCAVVLSFGIVAYYAEKSDSGKPLAVWLITAGGLLIVYEVAFRHRDDIDVGRNGST